MSGKVEPGQDKLFLLTPLREGRLSFRRTPASRSRLFLLTPLREGRHVEVFELLVQGLLFLLTPLREGRHVGSKEHQKKLIISTHAPAGGATRGNYA